MIMENDDRDRDDVPESWEEGSEKPIQALESKIEEAKLKNKQLQLQQQQLQNVGCSDRGLTEAVENNSMNSGAPRTGGAPVIRILKRPESAGDLEKIKDGVTANKNSSGPQSKPAASGLKSSGSSTKSLEERATAYAQARERIFGVIDPVIHEDLPIQ